MEAPVLICSPQVSLERRTVGAKRRNNDKPESKFLRLLYVGSFSSDKGLEEILHAIARATQRDLIRLTVAGDGTPGQRRKLRLIAEKLGIENRIEWLGWVETPSALYGHHDLLVIASRNEAYGLVAEEARFASMPMIAYHAGATPEVAGPGALLIAPDVNILSATIDSFALDSSQIVRLQTMMDTAEPTDPRQALEDLWQRMMHYMSDGRRSSPRRARPSLK